MDKEIRSYDFEMRAENREDGKGEIFGRPIVYGSRTDLGWFDETIAAGALDNADLKDVRLLVNHDTSMIPLARSRNNNKNSTMQLSPDDEGLSFRATLDTENNAEAKSLYSAIDRGDVTGMSFMFTVDGVEWLDLESDHPTRVIKSISKVFEVSAVTFPAYESTSIGVRDREALESAKTVLESARASLESERRAAALEKFNQKWRADE